MPDADARATDALDAPVVRAWARLTAGALGRERDAIDGVNVFPVADGDTGTNMYQTVREGARAVAAAPDAAGAAALLRRLARGALLGARGNSGVILSEWLRGVAIAATRGDAVARALDVAAGTARAAVAHPEPGTILTAADVAAAAARDVAARPGASADDVLEAAVRGAREAALSSVATLAPLARAGVLDAGACGLVLVLDALRVARRFASAESGWSTSEVGRAGSTVTGSTTAGLTMAGSATAGSATAGSPTSGVSVATTTMLAVLPVTLGLEMTGHDAVHTDAAEPHVAEHHGGHTDADEVEVMFVLRRPAGAHEFADGAVADALRSDLAAVGGSVVVVGGADLGSDDDSAWQAHVHTPDLGAALGVARRWAGRGRVEPVHVRHLAVPDSALAVVASTDAPTLAAELARAGAVVLVPVPPVGVSARDLALAAVSAGPRTVLVLGGAPHAVRTAVARLATEHGEAGLAADHDAVPHPEAGSAEAGYDAGFEDGGRDDGTPPDVVALDTPTDVHAAVVVAALAAAADDPHTDVVAVVRGALDGLRAAVTDADDGEEALRALLADGGEVVTVLADDGVPAEVVAELEDVAEERGAECVALRTGRAGTGVAIGVER